MPFKRKNRYSPIGIDLGSSMIKMLQLKGEANKASISCKALLPSPAGAIENGEIRDPDSLAGLLKDAYKRFNWSGRKVNLCLDSRLCHTCKIALPPLKRKELDQAIRRKAEHYFAVDPKKTVISSFYIGPESNNGYCVEEYLLTAVSKKLSDSVTAAVDKAGLKPLSLEIDPTAALRALYLNPRFEKVAPGDIQLLIDLGYSRTALLFVSEGRYSYHRSIHTGLVHFLKSAQSIAAEKNIRVKDLIFSRNSLASRGLHTASEELARGIIQSIDYWSEDSKIVRKRKLSILLSGGGLLIPGLAEHLRDNIDHSLEIFNPLQDFNPRIEGKKEKRDNSDLLFTNSLGLALKGWF